MNAQSNIRRLLGGGSRTEYRYTMTDEKGPWCMHDLPYDQPCMSCDDIEMRNHARRYERED